MTMLNCSRWKMPTFASLVVERRGFHVTPLRRVLAVVGSIVVLVGILGVVSFFVM